VGVAVGVADRVAVDVAEQNAADVSAGRLGSIGLVVGATVDRSDFGLADESLRGAPLLAPGFGAQGARPADLMRLFGDLAPAVIASESRSLLSAGPNGLADAIDSRIQEYRSSNG